MKQIPGGDGEYGARNLSIKEEWWGWWFWFHVHDHECCLFHFQGLLQNSAMNMPCCCSVCHLQCFREVLKAFLHGESQGYIPLIPCQTSFFFFLIRLVMEEASHNNCLLHLLVLLPKKFENFSFPLLVLTPNADYHHLYPFQLPLEVVKDTD